MDRKKPRYKPTDLRQDAFVPLCFGKQILPGAFEYALHHLLEYKVDLSAFDAHYSNTDVGACAYHPKVLLKLVLFGYARGLIGSRRIERACRENVQFMALGGEAKPDHSTIAAFISRSPDAIKAVFQEVLLVCDEAGLIGREHFAIDGVKLPSNASKDWSGRLDELQAKADKLDRAVERMLEAHRLADKDSAEDDLHKHAAQQIDKLEKQSAKIKSFLTKAKPKLGPNGKERKSNVTDNESAKMATGKGVMQGYTAVAVTDNKHQIICEAQAHGVPQEQELLQPILADMQDSFRTMDLSANILAEGQLSADAGFHSSDNLEWLEAEQCDAYVADNRFRKRDPRFVDADKYKPPKPEPKRFTPKDFEYDPALQRCTCPAGKALYRNGSNVTIDGRSGIKFTAPKSACSGCHLRAKCLRDPNQKSARQVVFFKEPADRDNAIARMKHKIDSPIGRKRYSQRLGTVEPPFGNLRYHKGLDRFTLRGRAKVDGQWKLYAMVHNIEKWGRYAMG
ncbi:MAG: IS1182 family transposase [Gammaproteobacteria bacterium]|nr:IS1182 family transposase [Gammaproteobacteria bacterium]